MKLSPGEKKLFAFSALVIALPLGVGLFFNRINATPVVSIPAPPKAPNPNGFDLYVAAAGTMMPTNPPVDAVNNPRPITDPKARAQQYSLARKNAWLAKNTAAFKLFDQAMKTPSLAPRALFQNFISLLRPTPRVGARQNHPKQRPLDARRL